MSMSLVKKKLIFKPKRVLLYTGLILITTSFLLPFLWLISSSFKIISQIQNPNFNLIPLDDEGNIFFAFENYRIAFEYLNLPRLLSNTLFVCVVNTALNLLFNSLAGYAFARINFKGREFIFRFVLLSMMVPGTVMTIPNLIIVSRLGIDETRLALILPFVMSIYNIFLMRQNFLTLSKELEEAARIDGAGRLTIFFRIAMPLVTPILIVLGITTFMWNYNSFMWPLVSVNTNESVRTLALGLGSLVAAGSFNAQMYPAMLAGSVVASIPLIIIFFCFQRYIMEGINVGGVKG